MNADAEGLRVFAVREGERAIGHRVIARIRGATQSRPVQCRKTDSSAQGPEVKHRHCNRAGAFVGVVIGRAKREERQGDRKSTRLNSSHSQISYAVFCLKKKKKK